MKNNLRDEINKINLNKSNPYYGEEFCSIVLDYIGSVSVEGLTDDDLKVLEENQYTLSDFMEE